MTFAAAIALSRASGPGSSSTSLGQSGDVGDEGCVNPAVVAPPHATMNTVPAPNSANSVKRVSRSRRKVAVDRSINHHHPTNGLAIQ
jgi:hypothetical protein